MRSFRLQLSHLIQSVVILTCVLVLGAGEGYGQQAEEAIGFMTAVEGEVLLFRPGETAGEQAQLKDNIFLQDTVATGAQSKTKIVFKDDSILSLGENTRMEITAFVFHPEQNLRQSVFTAGIGKIRALVGRLFGEESQVQVRTPTAIAGVRGTYFIVDVISEEITAITVLEGEVKVTNILEAVAGEVTLRTNESTRVQSTLPPSSPVIVPPQTLDTLKRETQVIEEAPPTEIPQGTDAPGGDIKSAGLPLTPAEVKSWERADEAATTAAAPAAAPAPAAASPSLEVVKTVETLTETGLVTAPGGRSEVPSQTGTEAITPDTTLPPRPQITVGVTFPGR